ncbi:MAG: hypothetical protein KA715_04525 [Xanthomonadaceae bacterium]|nr:hypothetical protein [Xanthomonadaceae bacterium]
MNIILITFFLLVASQSAIAEVKVGDQAQVKLGENRRGISAEAAHCKVAQLKRLQDQNDDLVNGSKARAAR